MCYVVMSCPVDSIRLDSPIQLRRGSNAKLKEGMACLPLKPLRDRVSQTHATQPVNQCLQRLLGLVNLLLDEGRQVVNKLQRLGEEGRIRHA